jgi:protocatechuate 3,4-dioxygenase alpha subunit
MKAKKAAAPKRKAVKPKVKAKASKAAKGSKTSTVRVRGIVTPSQTVGPYYRLGFGPIPALKGAEIPGERVTITGRLLDGDGAPVPDGMLETWQANARGKYDHPEDWQDKQTTPGFSGFGRWIPTKDGTFHIETLRPGAVPYPGTDSEKRGTEQAPHLVVTVFSRGLLKHLITRIYFEGDPMLAGDPVLKLVKDGARRDTLIAKADPAQPGAYRWDVRLQGVGETVFFDV